MHTGGPVVHTGTHADTDAGARRAHEPHGAHVRATKGSRPRRAHAGRRPHEDYRTAASCAHFGSADGDAAFKRRLGIATVNDLYDED